MRKLRHRKDPMSYIYQRDGLGLELNLCDDRASVPRLSLHKQRTELGGGCMSVGVWFVKEKSGS